MVNEEQKIAMIVSLPGKDFSNSTLECVNLEDGNLINCNFSNSSLVSTNFTNANLQGACFRNADLTGAYLQGANLQGANLEGAILEGTDLYGANLQDANLKNTILEKKSSPGKQLTQEEKFLNIVSRAFYHDETQTLEEIREELRAEGVDMNAMVKRLKQYQQKISEKSKRKYEKEVV